MEEYKYLKIESLQHPDMEPVLIEFTGHLVLIRGAMMKFTLTDKWGNVHTELDFTALQKVLSGYSRLEE